MTHPEHDGFLKAAMGGGPGAWTAARKAFKASARTVPAAGKPVTKAKSPMLRAGTLLTAGAAVGAAAGVAGASAAHKQAPMAPGSLAREKRRQQADRHGNY